MNQALGMGWLKDQPDHRDFTLDNVRASIDRYGVLKMGIEAQPVLDLRQYCTPIENQGNLGSCTAHAAIGALEFMNKKATGLTLDLSRRFVYKVTRNLLQWTGDTGAYLRSVAGALVYFGAPPEKYWPYIEGSYDVEPSAFHYGLADNYLVEQYARLDPPGTKATSVLVSIKNMLTKGIPVMFGFTVYESINKVTSNGVIPYPTTKEKVMGGHAMLIVGYDDTNQRFLIRNSWGTSWGDKGYGWLPYKYLLNGLASDFWMLLSSRFADVTQFTA